MAIWRWTCRSRLAAPYLLITLVVTALAGLVIGLSFRQMTAAAGAGRVLLPLAGLALGAVAWVVGAAG